MSAPNGHTSTTFDVDVFKFRVGAPAPIPGQAPQKEDFPAGEESGTTTSKEAVSIAAEVLSKHGIVPQDIRFSPCGSQENSAPSGPRVLIVAPWHNDSCKKWPEAVREVKERIDNGAHGVGASVEIIAPQVGRGKEVGAIIGKPELERDSEEITEGVSSILESHDATKGMMNSLVIFRLGYSTRADENPITVFISMDEEADDEAWRPVLQDIQRYLDGWPHDLTAHMEHNEITGLVLWD